jgi:hypothetical protein
LTNLDQSLGCKKYIVCPSDRGGWIAKIENREAGPYVSRDLALQVAVSEAGQSHTPGQPICIVVEDARGEVSAARCICLLFEQYLAARTA